MTLVSNIVELTWLIKYPLPSKVIVDRGNEFLAECKTMTQANYGITVTSITLRNPQTNSILQKVHQTLGIFICTFKVQHMVLDDMNPWDGILASTIFALRATVHNMMQYTPAQLVFGQDSILNTRHEVNWQLIQKHKQDLISKGNQKKNCNKKEHAYKKGDKILLKNAWKPNSSKIHTWDPTQSQLSEIMVLLGHLKVK